MGFRGLANLECLHRVRERCNIYLLCMNVFVKTQFTAASIRDPGFVGQDKKQAACMEEGGGGVCV